MTDPMTPERLAELRVRAELAKPFVGYDFVAPPFTTIDAADLHALLDAADERDRLAAELAELRGNPRDEYHTMEELYEYRMLYNALAANAMPDRAVKSWRHSDGELCFGGGWFVVYLDLPTGQVSNHYKSFDWDLFRIPEVELAPEWDGHTPAEAADRILRALDDDEGHYSAALGEHESNREPEAPSGSDDE